ncbi:hypothetical protein LINGRAHAP2_LOCUS36419 [Linum grandiflorum]
MAPSVLLKIRGGKLVPKFTMPLTSTIYEVKKEIEAEIHIDRHRQTLSTYRGITMDNCETLASYGIREDRSHVNLELVVKPREPAFKITVLYSGKELKLKVMENYTVKTLKAMVLGKKTDIEVISRLQLTCDEKKIKYNDLPLSKYYMTEYSTIIATEDSRFEYDSVDEEDSTDWEEEEREEEEKEKSTEE